MTRLSLAGAVSAIVMAGGCARSQQSVADTATASSTATPRASVAVDAIPTTTESTTTVSTVTRKVPGKKSTTAGTRKTVPSNSIRPTDSVAKDSILGRDSVIRFPIRRLPTASSSPVKR